MTYNECDWLQRKQSESLGNILGNNDELSEAAAQILSFGPAMAHDPHSERSVCSRHVHACSAVFL